MVIRHIKPTLHQASVDLHALIVQEALTRQVVRRVVQDWRPRVREK